MLFSCRFLPHVSVFLFLSVHRFNHVLNTDGLIEHLKHPPHRLPSLYKERLSLSLIWIENHLPPSFHEVFFKKLDFQFRWHHRNVNSSNGAAAQGPAKEMSPLKHRPPPRWKSTSLGYIPSPKTPRAKFMNSLLPEFYKTQFKHCRNIKQFEKEFHGTGRELYHWTQQIDEIDNQIKSIMNKENSICRSRNFSWRRSYLDSTW